MSEMLVADRLEFVCKMVFEARKHGTRRRTTAYHPLPLYAGAEEGVDAERTDAAGHRHG